MKPLFALVSAATVSAASFLALSNRAEATFFPGSQMNTRPNVLLVQYGQHGPYRQRNRYRQYDPLQRYTPGRRQHSIAARAAFCRCYRLDAFRARRVCRYPGRPTTSEIVDRCY
jgi:hypothetical protein